MLNFALCDDNLSVLNRLSKMLESIFINHNIEGEIGLNLDFYKNENEKDKSKLRKNKKKLTEIEKSKMSKTNDNKSEKNLTLITVRVVIN